MKFCSNCGAQLEDNAAICVRCGAILGPSAPAQTAPAQPYSAQPYSAQPYSAQTAPGQPEQYPVVQQALKKKKTRLILALVLFAAWFAGVWLAAASEENSPILEPEKYTSESKYGDYVTTDLVSVTSLYTEKTTKNGATTSYYHWCFATNTDGEHLILKISDSDMKKYLSSLDTDEDDDTSAVEPVTIRADVRYLSSSFTEEIKTSAIHSALVDMVPNQVQLELVTYERHTGSSDGLIALAMLLFPVAIVFLILFFRQRTKTKQMVKAYTDYGDVERIRANVLNNRIFSDASIAADRNYIVSQTDPYMIVSTQEALNLYQYVHRTNFVVDTLALTVVNRYGEPIRFRYLRSAKDAVKDAILHLAPLCPNAAIGYSQSSQQHVYQHVINRPKR